jgi:hypothetical protein
MLVQYCNLNNDHLLLSIQLAILPTNWKIPYCLTQHLPPLNLVTTLSPN